MSWQTTCLSVCHHQPGRGPQGFPRGLYVLGLAHAGCSPATSVPHVLIQESTGTDPASSRRRESPSVYSSSIFATKETSS
jgi:hypothetical protein